MFLTSDFSRKSGDKSAPPAIAPLAVNPTDSSEEKVDLGLQGNLSSLTLEGEEETRKVHHSEASEDTSSGALSQDSSDRKPLQGVKPTPVLQISLHWCSGRGAQNPYLGSCIPSFINHAPGCLSVCYIVSGYEPLGLLVLTSLNECSWLGGSVGLVLPVGLTLTGSVLKSL